MRNWKSIAGVILIFALGVVTGALVAGALIKRNVDHALAGGPPEVRQMVVTRLTRQLSLSAEQKSRVTAIVKDAQASMAAVRAEVQPQLSSALERAASDIRGVLTPEQRRKFDLIIQRNRERLKSFEP